MEFDRVPRIAKYLSATFLLSWFGRSTVWFFLPIYFEQHIASVFLIGIVMSLPSAIPILLDIPTGNLVQRAGEKIVIFLGLVAQIVPAALYITAAPAILVLGKAVEGLGKVLMWNGGWSLSLRSSDESVESESVSVFLLGVNLARIIGPIIGGYLIASSGFPITFKLWMFTASLAVLVFIGYIGVDSEKPFGRSMGELLQRKTYLDDWRHLRDNWEQMKYPFALIFLYSIIFSFYWLAVPLLLKQVDAGYRVMGVIFGVAAIPKAFQFVFGDIADRFGRLKTLLVLSAGLTPVLVAMNFLSGIMVVGAAFFVARLLSSGMSPAIHAVFDEKAPDELEGELTGFLEFFKHSGQALGPFVAGTVASVWSINVSFLAAGGVSILIFVASVYGIRSQ
ncbi:MAG: MFS transporter [Candidatus Nanohaloarchaea archaeon]